MRQDSRKRGNVSLQNVTTWGTDNFQWPLMQYGATSNNIEFSSNEIEMIIRALSVTESQDRINYQVPRV